METEEAQDTSWSFWKAAIENRGYIIIAFIFVLSAVYLSYIFSILNSATDLKCIEENGEVELDPFGLGSVSVVCEALSLNEVGDYIAGLVSLLATGWLVVAFVWQAMELAFQRREFHASNAIAKSRASSEDIWRRLELHELFREKLSRTVNETCTIKARLANKPAPAKITVISDMFRVVDETQKFYDPEEHDIAQQGDIERLNSLIATNNGIVAALRKLESDQQLKDYLDLFR